MNTTSSNTSNTTTDYDRTGLSNAQYYTLVIIGSISCILSLLGSITIIYLARKKIRYQTYHRLILGLSISDIIVSVSVLLESYILPISTGYPLAIGNIQSCTTIGFTVRVSAMSVALYNCILSICFLLIVQYNWKRNDFSIQIEFITHIVIWTIPTIIGITGIISESFNPRTFLHICDIAPYPSDCLIDDTIDCTRGLHSVQVDWASVLILLLAMIIGTIASIRVYIETSKRIRNAMISRSANDATQQSNNTNEALESFLSNIGTQSILYTLAYLNSAIWPAINAIVTSTVSFHGREHEPSFFTLQFISWLFFPIQGFFNFFIYIRPRFYEIRRQYPQRSVVNTILTTILVAEDNNNNINAMISSGYNAMSTDLFPAQSLNYNTTTTRVEVYSNNSQR